MDRLLEADLVVFDQTPRGFDDLGRAAIVVRQRDPLEPRIGEVELDDPSHAGPAPSVQGLVLVADAEEPILGRREDPYEQLLRRLDVLVLVDQNLPEAALPAPAKIGVLTQRPHCGEHEVIEVVDSPLCQLAFIVLVDDRQRLAVRMPVGLLGELARRRQQPELDPADRGTCVRRLHPRARLAQPDGAQASPLIERRLAHPVPTRQPLLAHQPPADAVERPGGDGLYPDGPQALLELNPRVAVERGAQDLLCGHAAAEQLSHALDQDRRLAAPRGRDHLDDTVVGVDSTPLLGVELDRGRRHRPWGLGQREAAIQTYGTVDRALECVRIGEVRVDVPLWGQAREALLALDHQRGPGPERRLEHVAVQRREIIQIADPDADDGQPIRSRDAVEPVLRWVVDALTPPVHPARGRDDLPSQRGELDQLMPRGHQRTAVNRRGPGEARGHRVNVLPALRRSGLSPAARGIDPQPGRQRAFGQGHEWRVGPVHCRGLVQRSLDPSRSRYGARHRGCHRFVGCDGI